MQLKQLADYLNTYFQIELFSDFCPNGIQVEGRERIEKMATAVSANLQTIEQAVKEGVDVLIVHHGIFWNRDPYPIVGAKRKKLERLLQHGISLLAYHLPMDAHQEIGNNWKAARDLGWSDLETFSVGVKGKFPSESIENFQVRVEQYYNHKASVALAGKEKVQSAALISGGAYRELSNAAKEGVDCFITGNFDEPAWGTAYEEQIHFLALGHSATERVGPIALAHHLQDQFKTPCIFIDIENPF